MKRLHVGWLALCASAAAAATPAVWTGGGGGGSVGEAGNWDRADAVERLADGSLLATFASAGTGASVDRAVAFFGVVFDTPHADGFALSAGGASAALALATVAWIVFGQALVCGHAAIHLNLAIVLGTVTLVLSGVLLGALRPGAATRNGGTGKRAAACDRDGRPCPDRLHFKQQGEGEKP